MIFRVGVCAIGVVLVIMLAFSAGQEEELKKREACIVCAFNRHNHYFHL